MAKTAPFILDIYKKSRELDLHQFKEYTFSRLLDEIHFDSGLWLEGIIDGQLYEHGTYLYNQPPEMLENYQRYADMDFLNGYVRENPGQVINPLNKVSREALVKTEIYQGHCQKYKMEETLSIAFPLSDLSIYSHISLFRGKGAEPFQSEDEEIFQQISPHMVEAYKSAIYLSTTLSLSGGKASTGSAVVDRHGCIHFSTDSFRARVCAQWKEWRGPQVPEPLRPDAFGDEALVLDNTLFKAREVSEGLHLIIASPTPENWSQLTQSEQNIALLLARGVAYKEIANQLDISPSTVTNHANNIYQKLCLHTRAELANLLSSIVF